jgi:Concanavalin A-like lectin/glucanases superfamily
MKHLPLVVLLWGCGRFRFSEETGTDGGAKNDRVIDVGPDAASLLDGCVLMMHMDEPAWTGAAGEVIDSCSTNNGTAVGGITTVPNGTRGRAGSFNGTGCIQVADAPNLHLTTGLTISAWIYPTGDPANSFGIVSKRLNFGDEPSYSLFLWTNNQIYGDIDTEDIRIPAPTVFPSSVWKQTTIVYDGSLPEASRVTFYVDGAVDLVTGEASASITQFTTDLAVGCLPLAGIAQQFIGEIDDVAIWNRPLSADEVASWHLQTEL